MLLLANSENRIRVPDITLLTKFYLLNYLIFLMAFLTTFLTIVNYIIPEYLLYFNIII